MSPKLPPAVFGISSIVAAFVAFLLPETADAELPDDIDELEFGPWLRRCSRTRRNVTLLNGNVPDIVLSSSKVIN